MRCQHRGDRTGKRLLYMFIIPVVAFLCFFFLYPLFFAFYISWFDYSLGDPTRTFIGFQNYREVFRSTMFRVSTYQTVLFVFGAVFLQLVFGLALAMLLKKESILMYASRTIVLLPMALPPLVVALVFGALFNPSFGVATYYIQSLGIDLGTGLFTERSTALLGIILVDVWQWTPLMMIMLLAGLKSLPKELYEAARVDGASHWRLFRYITLPLLRPVIVVALVTRAIGAARIFDSVWAITGGGPGTATNVLNFYLFETGIHKLEIGHAAAIGNIFLAFCIPLVLLSAIVLFPKRTRRRM